jgi:hypothetical protein
MNASEWAGGESGALVYGEVDGGLIFMGEHRARSQAQIYEVLASATTWGELRGKLPEETFREMVALQRDEQEAPPDDARPFAAAEFIPYVEGDWPPWPAQQMLEWMPARVGELGSSEPSAVSGDSLALSPEREPEIVRALEGEGFTCRRDDDLVRRASHGS